MKTTQNRRQRYPLPRYTTFFISILTILLMLTFTACGSNTGSTSGRDASAHSTPSPTLTTIAKDGTAHGCPGNTVVTTAPAKANVLIEKNNARSTVSAHVNDIIEVRLPFGQRWTGPSKTDSGLELQTPSGYAWSTDNVCVWRFVAKSAGTFNLEFTGQALCERGKQCPMYMMVEPFTIEVKS